MRKILLMLSVLALTTGWVGQQAWADDKGPVQAPDDQVLGKPDAPVTIFEYASFTCPHCAAFTKETLPKIKSAWIDTGKAKLIFRDFPLDQIALKAAIVAHCAPEGRYFTFVEAFFDSQDNWARATDPVAGLKGIARLGGMNSETFDKCLKDEAIQNKTIESELTAKNSYGVDSTPSFFVVGANGTNKLVGEQPFDDFNRALVAAQPKS